MTYTDEECQFIKFLKYFSNSYKKAYVIANNKYGKTILPVRKGRNEFEMYALDDICESCNSFYEDGILFTPKTTDAIWYGKENGNFYIYLIEFKGDCLFKNSKKCDILPKTAFLMLRISNNVTLPDAVCGVRCQKIV